MVASVDASHQSELQGLFSLGADTASTTTTSQGDRRAGPSVTTSSGTVEVSWKGWHVTGTLKPALALQIAYDGELCFISSPLQCFMYTCRQHQAVVRCDAI